MSRENDFGMEWKPEKLQEKKTAKKINDKKHVKREKRRITLQQVTWGRNIVAHGWRGAPRPPPKTYMYKEYLLGVGEMHFSQQINMQVKEMS